ncbi:hypothetical protein M231_01199 [Tremella mesenterica]|uniref:Uncharacterized protein n=1 Tax=Tremella mesenterica TaxID=5217 RepID=A0A4Q1BTT2_TREME|nr:hypothetical protein M231_01199 [Tremella mesenterica]
MSTDSTPEARMLLRHAKTFLNPEGWSIGLAAGAKGSSAMVLFATVPGTRTPCSPSLIEGLGDLESIEWEKDFKLQMSTSPLEQVEAIGKGVQSILAFALVFSTRYKEVSDSQRLAQKRDIVNMAGESWLRGAGSLLHASNGEMSRFTPLVKSCQLMRTMYENLDDEQCSLKWQDHFESFKILASDYFDRHPVSQAVKPMLQTVIQTLSEAENSAGCLEKPVPDTTWMDSASVDSPLSTKGKGKDSGLSKAQKKRAKAQARKQAQEKQRKEAAAIIGKAADGSNDEHVQKSTGVKATTSTATPKESPFGPSKNTEQSGLSDRSDQGFLSWKPVSKRRRRENLDAASPDETKVKSTPAQTTPTMPVLFISPKDAADMTSMGWEKWYNIHFPRLSSKCSQNDVKGKELTIRSPDVTPSSSPIIKPDNTMEESQATTHSGDDLSPQNSEIMLSPSLPETPADVTPNELAWFSQYNVMAVVTHPGFTHPGVDAPAALISVPVDQMHQVFRSEYPGEGWQWAPETTTTSPGHQHVGPLLHMTPGGLLEVAYKGYLVSGDNRSQ